MKKTTKKKEEKKEAPKRSDAYIAQKAYLEKWASTHPEKWEANKEALLAKLEQL